MDQNMQNFVASSAGWLSYGPVKVRCAIGRNGAKPAHLKREGDGASPLGAWPIRRVLYRADKMAAPDTALTCASIGPDDGWCDAADDPNYNRPVTHPYKASAEHMWRDDDLYDIVVVLGHNDDPVVAGMGSAIFMHVASPEYGPTAGCVALSKADLLDLLAVAKPGDCVEYVL